MVKSVQTSFKKKKIAILDGYTFCKTSKKKVIYNNGFVWCEGNTKCKDKTCSTLLFSRDKEAPQNEPDSWEFEAKSNIKIRAKEARIYYAFCVDKIKL